MLLEEANACEDVVAARAARHRLEVAKCELPRAHGLQAIKVGVRIFVAAWHPQLIRINVQQPAYAGTRAEPEAVLTIEPLPRLHLRANSRLHIWPRAQRIVAFALPK